MDMVLDVVLDAGKDTLVLIPFLLVTYLALEALEHAAGARLNALVRRAGAAGPVVGAVLGVVPQCGFSAMGATLYAGRVVTLGTLVAVFLSTSDEMLPMLVAERVDAGTVAGILLVKMGIALVTGLCIDAAVRLLRRRADMHEALRRTVRGGEAPGAATLMEGFSEAGEGCAHIHRLCEQDHCGCDEEADVERAGAAGSRAGAAAAHGAASASPDLEATRHARHADTHLHGAAGASGEACACAHGHAHAHGGAAAAGGIVRSAVSHTLQVSLFIFLVTLVLTAVLETVGEDALAAFLSGNEGIAVFASGLVGLVPNCSASVVITQLYLEGVLGYGPMMAGLLVSAGVGYLVLFRTNRHVRENLVILGVLYVLAVACGFALMAFA